MNARFQEPLLWIDEAVRQIQDIGAVIQAKAELTEQDTQSLRDIEVASSLMCTSRMVLAGENATHDRSPAANNNVERPIVEPPIVAMKPIKPIKRRTRHRPSDAIQYKIEDSIIGRLQRNPSKLDRLSLRIDVQREFPEYAASVPRLMLSLLVDEAIVEDQNGTLRFQRNPSPRKVRIEKMKRLRKPRLHLVKMVGEPKSE